jgi:NADH-quinone oxidoreductase subunit E
MSPENVLDTVERHSTGRDGLISILQEVQGRYGYLPADALRAVAARTGRSLVDVYGVATFYRSFSLKPRGKHVCTVCLGTACHVRGAPVVAKEFERQLGVKPGETTPDREFTLETVNCLGACALGPVVVVDGRYFSSVGRAKVKQIITEAPNGLEKVDLASDRRVFPVSVSCGHCNHSLMDPEHPIDDLPSIRLTGSAGLEHGWVRLSSLYGSDSVESQHDVPVGTLVEFSCPHCHADLTGVSRCPECRGPMSCLIVRAGAVLHVCGRRGCKGHMLDLS